MDCCEGRHDDVLGFICPYGCQGNLQHKTGNPDTHIELVESVRASQTASLDRMSSKTGESDGTESTPDSDNDSCGFSSSSEESSEEYSQYEFKENLENEELVEDPGKFEFPLHSLTSMDLTQHNRKYGKYAVWWRYENHVYDVKRVYIILSPLIRSRCRELGKTRREYRQIQNILKYSVPQFAQVFRIANMLKLPLHEVNLARSVCKIGELRIFTEEEKYSEIQIGVELVIPSVRLSMILQLAKYPQGEEYLKSFLLLCEEIKKDPRYAHPLLSYGDPNQYAFPLPPWFEKETVRPYLNNYVPFETSIDTDYFRRDRIYEVLSTEKCQKTFEKYLRPWINKTEPFETAITGAVWQVFQEGVVKHDVLTKSQRRTLEARESRTDLNDRDRMRRRRDKLFKYFADKYYTHRKQDVDKFKQWAGNLEESEKLFLQLC